MTKPLHPDIKALAGAIRALDCSSSRQSLEANLRYLWDRYIENPNEQTLTPWTDELEAHANRA